MFVYWYPFSVLKGSLIANGIFQKGYSATSGVFVQHGIYIFCLYCWIFASSVIDFFVFQMENLLTLENSWNFTFFTTSPAIPSWVLRKRVIHTEILKITNHYYGQISAFDESKNNTVSGPYFKNFRRCCFLCIKGKGETQFIWKMQENCEIRDTVTLNNKELLIHKLYFQR